MFAITGRTEDGRVWLIDGPVRSWSEGWTRATETRKFPDRESAERALEKIELAIDAGSHFPIYQLEVVEI